MRKRVLQLALGPLGALLHALLAWPAAAGPVPAITGGLPGSGAALCCDHPTALLAVKVENEFSRIQGRQAWAPSRWLLVGAPALRVTAQAGRAISAAAAMSAGDSLRYVSLRVEAARSFHADIRIYDNLGQYVNKFTFSVPASEFSKLPLSSDGRARRLTVLWDNRSEDGRLVGTGTYVLKTTVALDRLPGLPEEDASKTEYRRVGVLRSH